MASFRLQSLAFSVCVQSASRNFRWRSFAFALLLQMPLATHGSCTQLYASVNADLGCDSLPLDPQRADTSRENVREKAAVVSFEWEAGGS